MFTDSLDGDELSAYVVVTEHGLAQLMDIVESDQEITPPLFFLLAKITQGWGNPMDSLRLDTLVAGAAAIPLTYLLGARALDRRAAIVASCVMALSPFLISYSTEARPYILLMLLCLGSTLALVHALDRAGKVWWAVYALLSCAAMYTHYTGVFVLAAQAVWALVFFRDRWRWIVGANVVAAIGWAPWLPSYRADQDSPAADLIGNLQPFGLDAIRTDILHWSIGHPIPLLSVRDMPGEPALVLIGLALVIGLAFTALEAARARFHAKGRPPGPGPRAHVGPLHSASGRGLQRGRRERVPATQPDCLVSGAWRSPGGGGHAPAADGGLGVGQLPAHCWFRGRWGADGPDEAERPDYKTVASFIAARGGDDAVVVDSPGPSPGPLTSLDVAVFPRPGGTEGADDPQARPPVPRRSAEREPTWRSRAPRPASKPRSEGGRRPGSPPLEGWHDLPRDPWSREL